MTKIDRNRIPTALSVLAAAAVLLLAARSGQTATPDELQPPPPGIVPPQGLAPPSASSSLSPSGTVAVAPPVPPTDHDAVVGHWGIEARRIDAGPYPLALLSPSGCSPVLPVASCTVEMGAISVRHWKTRNLAWNTGLAFALGGGRQGSTTLDTYYGVGPIVGFTVLLGNWRHLAVGASPEASLIYFKPSGGSSPSTKLITFRAQLEGELHFGFVDVPALSVGIATGLAFRYESAPGAATWSVSVGDARSVWGTLSNLFIRYYL